MKPTSLCAVFCAALLLLAAAAEPVQAGRLNDTGQVNCFSASAQTGTVTSATPNAAITDQRYARQDCTRGLSAADALGRMSKVGASGTKGRDYSKISNSGAVLDASATLGSGPADWACTRDNITGVVWEIKTSDGGVRDLNRTYTVANAAAYPATINGLALCGYTDWRLPTLRELLSLVDANTSNPAIDTLYFPNTTNGLYWSGIPNAAGPAFYWYVRFSDGFVGSNQVSSLAVRLVRSVP